MNNEQKMVQDFHNKYGCMVNDKPNLTDIKTRFLRARLIIEEAAEFLSAAQTEDLEQMADSLCDLLVVVYGTAVVLGMDLEPLFKEVHRSNMTKDGGGQDVGGKVMKGPDYEPPDLMPILEKQQNDGWETDCWDADVAGRLISRLLKAPKNEQIIKLIEEYKIYAAEIIEQYKEKMKELEEYQSSSQ